MKFLDLNTGYTFDGLWKNISSYTDWTIYYRDVPKVCEVCDAIFIDDSTLRTMMNDPYNELLYSSNPNAVDPGESEDWNSQFDFNNTCKFAVRQQVPQTKGYIFWFPNEQSIGITYTMPICILTETDEPLTLNMEENNIFSFISSSGEEVTIDGYKFGKPNYSKTITTEPQHIGKYYAHVVSVSCLGQAAGEYICKVSIDDNSYIRIGADLYGEDEPIYINLANMGVELPEMIQKAIYDVDPHEDVKNNIIINRKFKELLSNYWDVVANKGSYKSLINSLKWFEWGDILNVKEIWKHNVANKTMFDDRSIMSMFENKINDSYYNFIKTTYISLYCSMIDEQDIDDGELNPTIFNAVMKWSRDDIQLKMTLLSQFFGLYFMPIHMSILHATAEDKVFTNTIKAIHGGEIKRDDCFGDFTHVECNIKDNSIFRIVDAKAQVTSDTIFGVQYDDNNPDVNYSFGVDNFTKSSMVNESNLKTFATQYYTGPGVIIPIEFTIPIDSAYDFVKTTIIDFEDENDISRRLHFYNVFKSRRNTIKINFNYLATLAKEYSIRFTFITGSSKTLTRTVNFVVEDADNVNINIYKVKSKDDNNGFSVSDFYDDSLSSYLFRIQKSKGEDDARTNPCYTQYLPYMPYQHNAFNDYTGIKLNRTIVFDIQNKNGLMAPLTQGQIDRIRYVMRPDYLEIAKFDDDGNGELTYLIYVSKKFYAELPSRLTVYLPFCNIIRNDLVFYPQFHYLEKLNGNSIDDYTLTQYDALCCAVEVNDGNTTREFKYGNLITESEWYFINSSTKEYIPHPNSSRQPFIAKSNNTLLEQGYYDIIFNYCLTDGNLQTCKLSSAFRIKYI